jgi:putative transposase
LLTARPLGLAKQLIEHFCEKAQDQKIMPLDARYEKVREDGVIRSRTAFVAIGINWEGLRNVLAVDLINRESHSSWRDFLLATTTRVARSGVRGQ